MEETPYNQIRNPAIFHFRQEKTKERIGSVMNTIQLECFLAVAELLNFSKASQALKLTQPAVSHQIQTLEEELGVKLFIRTSRNVELTQEGILFMPDASILFPLIWDATTIWS